jgi:hypothetical protein
MALDPSPLPQPQIAFLNAARVRNWTGRIASATGLQALIQALLAIAGMLIIRTLSKQEYSYYTLATSLLAVITTLSDAGISVGLLAIGGKVWTEPAKLGALLRTGFQERRRLFIPVTFGVVIVLFYLLQSLGAKRSQTLLICVTLAGIGFFQYQAAILAVALRLHSAINRLQLIDAAMAFLRLLCLGLILATLPYTTALLLITAVLAAIQCRWYYKSVSAFASLDVALDPALGGQLRSTMVAMLPNILFQCFQGQIAVFLLAIFNKTTAVAELGAVSRLAMIFAIFGSLNANLMHPAVARLRTRESTIRGFWSIFIVNLLIGGGFVAATIFFPRPLLWILGDKYSNLQFELTLAVVGAALTLISGAIWGVAAAKGWVHNSWIYIPATLTGQIIGIVVFDLQTVRGVLCLNILGQLFALVAFLVIVWKGFRETNGDQERRA